MLSLANGFNEYSRSVPSLVLSFFNTVLILVFILRFKGKIDFVVKSTRSKEDFKDEQEIYASLHTLMFQNISRKFKIHKTDDILSDLFRTIYDDKLVKVIVVPDLRSLDYMDLKAKELRLKIEHFEKRNYRQNARYIIKVKQDGIKKEVDAVDYFEDQLDKIEADIERTLKKEYRFIGTVFVTFTDDMAVKDAIAKFNQFKKDNKDNRRLMEGFMMSSWTVEKAPLPKDLDWKNLAYDANHRCSR